MATKEDILGIPLQPTFMDNATGTQNASAVQPDDASDGQDETGVENVTVNHEGVKEIKNQIPATTVPMTPRKTENPKLSYVEMFKKMNPYAPPTPEQIDKERKRQKRNSIFAAIGDGISALSNLYFATQGAPNAYNPQNSMSGRMRERYDKLQKDREANRRAYMEGYLRAVQMDEANARDERNWRHTLEREAVADDWKERQVVMQEAKADRDERLAEIKIQLQLGKLTEQEYRNEIARIKAEYADEMERVTIGAKNRSGRSEAGMRTVPKYAVFDENGDVVGHVWTKAEAVSETERNGGTYPVETSESERKSESGSGLAKKTSTSTWSNKKGTTGNRSKREKQEDAETTPGENESSQQPTSRRPNPMGEDNKSNNGRRPNPMS